MTNLLHLDSSAHRSNASVSRRLTASFADTWRGLHGPSGYRYRDLSADPVLPLGPAFCELGRRLECRGLLPPAEVATAIENAEEEREWALTRPLIDELLAADTVLIGAPMYNFSVPAALKTWIDRVSFPGALVDAATGESRLSATRVVVVATRGGGYGPGTPRAGWDFQTPYLRAYFSANGVTPANLHFVTVEMTVAGIVPHLARFRPMAAESLARARAEITALASRPSVCANLVQPTG